MLYGSILGKVVVITSMPGSQDITLYAYLDIDNPMVAWEVAVGRMISADVHRVKNLSVSSWQYNHLCRCLKYGLSLDFINEMRLELTREAHFRENVSRLQGLYFFETPEAAKLALKYWRIPLKESHISPIRFFPKRMTKVDSEWITANIDKEEDPSWMSSYWNGEIKGRSPLYEILATGFGEVLNYDLRVQAYRSILEIWPYSTPLLAMACCAFQVKGMNDIAAVMPGLYAEGKNVCGDYVIDISDLDNQKKEIIEAVNICRENGTYPQTTKPKDTGAFFILPDLASLGFSFESPKATDMLKQIKPEGTA